MKNSSLIYLILLLPLILSTGCSSTRPGRDPLQFGICQPGAMWPDGNMQFERSPSAYERELWGPLLKSPRRQDLYDDFSIVWLRQGLSWNKMEPEEGEWMFRKYDWVMETAAEHGRKMLFILAYDTPWLYGDEETSRNITADERESYLNYVRTAARRYGSTAGGFEVWNEPNFNKFWKGNDEDFFILTREAVRIIREEAPDVPVAVGALSYHPLSGGRSFLGKMIKAGALDGADAISIHPYAMSLNAAARRVAGVRTLLQKNNLNHRVWVTEMGFPTTGFYPHRVSLANHYDQTFKAMTLMTAAGADLITWYKLFDSYDEEDAGIIVDSERSFGLMSRKEEWKPGAYAYKLLAGELGGMIYSPDSVEITGFQRSQARTYCYTDNKGRYVILAWPRDRGKTLTFRTEGLAGGESIYSPFDAGHSGPVLIKGTGNGEVSLRIGVSTR